MKVFFDTDILIWHLRGSKQALHFFKKVSEKDGLEWWIGALNRAEIVFFMRPSEEERTRLFLTRFNTHPVDSAIVDAASALYRQWNPSHGMDINDAILAATAEQNGALLYTLNTKHYPLKTLYIEKAW